MADRQDVILVDPSGRTPRTIPDRRGDGVGPLPPEGTGSRRGQETVRVVSSGRREFSYNGSNAFVPVIIGGPLKVGGLLIYEAIKGGNLYHHWAVCEGPLGPVGAISNIRLSGVPVASCKGTTETHIGAAGDTTSSLIGAVEFGYTFPEGVAGVVIKYTWPDQTTPRFNPYEFTADVVGWKAHDFSGAADATTTNPVRQAAQCLMNAAAGAGFVSGDFITAEWLAGQNACDFDIDPGAGVTKRWEISLRIDSQDFLENWVNKILEYACAHLRRDGAQYGLWQDLPRAVAQQGGSDLVYSDDGSTVNTLASKPTVVWRARNEIPTVCTVHYTDKANGYIDASVQIPDAGPAGEWIPLDLDRRGYMTREMARRDGTYELNLRQQELDITMEAWWDGALPLEGDRIRVKSRRLVPPGQTIPNVSGAVAGEEHLVVEEQTWGPSSVQLRCSQYRDTQFSDTIDTSGGPNPPGSTPNTPAAPTSLVLTTVVNWDNGVPVVRIKIEWTPAPDTFDAVTRIKYSRDNVNFYSLGDFLAGPAFLEGALLGVTHYFQLTTYRRATGQESSALTGNITPTAIDVTVPDVTQGLITPMGYFECYPPIGSVLDLPTNGPGSAPTATAAAGGVVPTGQYLVSYSWVYPWGETAQSPTVLVVITTGNQKISIGSIADGPGGVLFKKVYISNTDVVAPGAPMYVDAQLANGVTSILENSVVSWVTSNNTAPKLYDYATFINVYDYFGSPASPPLAFTVPVSSPPIANNRLDVRKLIHADTTTGLPRIDLLVAVVNVQGVQSPGKTYSNTVVAWPGGVPTGSTPEQTLMAMPAFDGQGLTLANGNNNNVALSGKHRQVISGPTAGFTITGIAGGTAGQRVTFINTVAQTMTIAHNSASSSTGNKIRCPGAANKAYTNQYASIDLEYHTDGFWYLIDT